MTPLERLTEAVDALTRPRTHREPLEPDQAPLDALTGKPLHGGVKSHVPALLTQLEEAVEPSGSVQGGHRVPSSEPAARIEALDVLLEIDTESTFLLGWFGSRPRDTLADTVRALVGHATDLDDDDPNLRYLATQVAAWSTRAAVVTGWELPAWAPDNTCPLCATHGSLRIRLDVSSGSGVGFCLVCREAWDTHTIGLLAAHIQWESDGQATGAHRTLTLADLEAMTWTSRCRGCDWKWFGRYKTDALLAAQQHRQEPDAMEESA